MGGTNLLRIGQVWGGKFAHTIEIEFPSVSLCSRSVMANKSKQSGIQGSGECNLKNEDLIE